MEKQKFIECLGSHFGEESIDSLLKNLAIEDTPKLPKGSYDTYLSSHASGMELVFTHERHLDVQVKEYPEGALVLSSIHIFGVPNNDYSAYKGDLPEGLRFGASRDIVQERLGEPQWLNKKGTEMRWDKGAFCIFCEFDDQGELSNLSVQLPIA